MLRASHLNCIHKLNYYVGIITEIENPIECEIKFLRRTGNCFAFRQFHRLRNPEIWPTNVEVGRFRFPRDRDNIDRLRK